MYTAPDESQIPARWAKLLLSLLPASSTHSFHLINQSESLKRTHNMSEHFASAVWPNASVRTFVTLGYLCSACTLSAFLAKRMPWLSKIKKMSLARALVLALLMDSCAKALSALGAATDELVGPSFLFVFTSAVLVLGIGTSTNNVACQVGIWWCILLF